MLPQLANSCHSKFASWIHNSGFEIHQLTTPGVDDLFMIAGMLEGISGLVDQRGPW